MTRSFASFIHGSQAFYLGACVTVAGCDADIIGLARDVTFRPPSVEVRKTI